MTTEEAEQRAIRSNSRKLKKLANALSDTLFVGQEEHPAFYKPLDAEDLKRTFNNWADKMEAAEQQRWDEAAEYRALCESQLCPCCLSMVESGWGKFMPYNAAYCCDFWHRWANLLEILHDIPALQEGYEFHTPVKRS